MDTNKNTASFLIRFTQKLWSDEKGDNQVQWRGNIRHVQDGNAQNFVDFEDAIAFIQQSLTNLTLENISDKDSNEKNSVLIKSFNIWKKFTTDSTQKMISAIKDPIGQLDALKAQVNEAVDNRIKGNTWLPSTRSDNRDILEAIAKLQSSVEKMGEKISALEEK